MRNKKIIPAFLKALAVLLIFNLAAAYLYIRIDLTEDRRYSLSQAAKNMVRDLEEPVFVDVLLDGDLPAEFIKLKAETKLLLQSFASVNKQIKFNFLNPLSEGQRDETMAKLQQLGLTPANITVEDQGKVSQEILYPWAIVNYNNVSVKVPLLKNQLGASTETRINNSVQNLEYAFSDAFSKLAIKEKKRVAIIKGNGELADLYMADYLTTIRDYYNIGAITLDSVATDPQKVLDQLKRFDLALIAKPTLPFTEQEKYVLDQFIIQGGKTIWLIDGTIMELDSLFNETGRAIALRRDLNLDDFFFKYGLRINPVLVNDLYFTQIVLATGDGSGSQYNPVPWYYHPMVFSRNNHAVNTNLEAVRFQFASTLDTLSNPYHKAILYWSSPLSRTDAVPIEISLDLINSPPEKERYNNGNQPLAVLIEGAFSSAYVNRIKPLKLQGAIENGPDNKMLVIADGDLIKNQLRNGRPLELGYDKWTNNFYGNKEFMVNAMNYLLDDSGLINIRNKKVSIPLLDQEKVAQQKTKWQLVNIGLPVVIAALFGLIFNLIRRKKYTS